MDIKRRVDLLINKYQTNCPFKLTNHLGIQVLYEPLGNILGYYSKHFRVKVIHINEAANQKKQQFICAHELGHAIMHPDANTPFLKKHTLYLTDRIEVEANAFAIELLLSNLNYDSITIAEAVEEYGIPKQLALSKSLG
ncbi:ImmA/IrrE family metallo-endopeptidase [Bacillus sp. 1P02SD]|uniref:ImmA/IrrE family metallo-endopeptidase n=1 Tax=Bacillus sp. 1P02SD TaxID=3132264 RepID=UPI0039A327AB